MAEQPSATPGPRTILVTGATAGIGLESATQLGMEGAVSRIRGVAHTTLSVGLDRGGKVQTVVVERKPFAL